MFSGAHAQAPSSVDASSDLSTPVVDGPLAASVRLNRAGIVSLWREEPGLSVQAAVLQDSCSLGSIRVLMLLRTGEMLFLTSVL